MPADTDLNDADNESFVYKSNPTFEGDPNALSDSDADALNARVARAMGWSQTGGPLSDWVRPYTPSRNIEFRALPDFCRDHALLGMMILWVVDNGLLYSFGSLDGGHRASIAPTAPELAIWKNTSTGSTLCMALALAIAAFGEKGDTHHV